MESLKTIRNPTLSIAEIQDLKKAAEAEILAALKLFEDTTGLSVESIDSDTMRVTLEVRL